MSPAGWCTFEVEDSKAMKQYFIGKSPRTVKAFYEWLESPNTTMKDMEKKYGATTLVIHSMNLQRMGILKKTLTHKPHIEKKKIIKEKRALIRKLTREIPPEKLDELISFLDRISSRRKTEVE